MTIRLQEVKILPELLMKQKLKCAAEKYKKYVDSDILVIYSKSKNSPFEMYEFMVTEVHFQHLAGVKYPHGQNCFMKSA